MVKIIKDLFDWLDKRKAGELERLKTDEQIYQKKAEIEKCKAQIEKERIAIKMLDEELKEKRDKREEQRSTQQHSTGDPLSNFCSFNMNEEGKKDGIKKHNNWL